MSSDALNAIKTSIDEERFGLVTVALNDFLLMDLPPREYLLEPWLPKAGICMVYAKRGVGKTFFALEIAMAVACGIPFLSFNAPKPAKVLYIDGEMPANVMQERFSKIMGRITPSTLMQQPRIITPDLQHGFMPDLSTESGQDVIRPYTDEADLIIIDNISTLGGCSKENEAQSWFPLQQLALELRRQGKSVLFIHHAGKSGTQRGTSKREDILDTSILLKHPSDYEPSSGACFELHFEKARGMVGEAVNPVYCWLTDEGWKYEALEDSNYHRAIELANQGLNQTEVATELELSKGYVSKLFKKGKALGVINPK
ncbi:AAA family ATPase [uncultured Legionella sp.]|uniref:AAA family ATPase n=1 Tax=uncultured Legionella sp. TaxID=210934 RepID=UPI00262381ED|nr:AAA family ATPase [uncultured Legionella sp.]